MVEVHTISMAEKPNQKHVLVTGGAGYIGSHTVVELVNSGYIPIIVDNFQNSFPECLDRISELVGYPVIFYEVNILNQAALEEVFQKHNIDHVIHFVGLKCVGESWDIPLDYYTTNVCGVIILLHVMLKYNVRNLVFSSSCTVYGDVQQLPISENQRTGSCTNPYGKSKYMNEEILSDFHRANNDWNIVMLRYFNPVGAHPSGKLGEDPQGVPNNLMPYVAQVAIGRRTHLNVFGNDYDTPDGTGIRDYIHVVDLAKGHVLALKKLEQKCGCDVYNLGTGQGYSVLEVVKAFSEVSGKEIPYKIAERRPGDVAVCYSNPEKAREHLNWSAKFGLKDMCAHMWNFQTLNPNGYRSSEDNQTLLVNGCQSHEDDKKTPETDGYKSKSDNIIQIVKHFNNHLSVSSKS